MTLTTDYIRKVCFESLVKTFLNPNSELYIEDITGEQWQQLIQNPESIDMQLLQDAFDEARKQLTELKQEEEVRKEYYEMLEEEYKQIKRENQAEIDRLRAADEGCTIDAWYNQGE